jgi:hypothetical protein
MRTRLEIGAAEELLAIGVRQCVALPFRVGNPLGVEITLGRGWLDLA